MSQPYYSWQQAILRSKLEPTTKLVCHTIGCHMAADGSGCFPSYALIADESGLSRRAVIDHVGKAAAAGFLEVDARQRVNGSATSNSYRPVMPGVVNQSNQGSEPAALGGSEPAAPQITTHSSNHSTNQVTWFEKFWLCYPNKVGRKACLAKWKSLGLDAQLPEILAGLERWKASDRWKRGYVVDPLTFLNQERWQDVPPAAPAVPAKGEVRVRESTAAEKVEAARNRRYMEALKAGHSEPVAASMAMEEANEASEAEIVEMMNQGKKDA